MADAYTVTQVNTYIKSLFARDFVLNRITVKGEVSNCKYHSAGHIYFTLKDKGGAISCMMFASQRAGLTFRLTDGQQIEAAGQISVYEKSGTYQLYVRSCRLSGSGDLYERFLKLKQELEEMGMFDPLYKKPIPRYCRRVGIVTAPTGAAVQDIINISRRRNPYVELVLCPALVQGDAAPASIVRGIRRLDALGLDVIIVGRGGGSIEDLWAFNEEIVAKAIFDADTPIISAVGHETDFTIADFVADLRAPTPSAAAELANFEYEVFMQELDARKEALRQEVTHRLRLLQSELTAKQERLKRLSPASVTAGKRQHLSELLLRMNHAIGRKTERAAVRRENDFERLKRALEDRRQETRRRLELAAARLDAGSPLKKISGGYGYLSDADGHAVTSAELVRPGDRLSVFVRDGKINTTVSSVEKTEFEGKLWQKTKTAN